MLPFSIPVELFLNQIKNWTPDTQNPHTCTRQTIVDVWFWNPNHISLLVFFFVRWFFWSFCFGWEITLHKFVCWFIYICRYHFLFFPKKLSFRFLFQQIIVRARENNLIRARARHRIDWLNYGFSCQLKWRSINETIEIHSFFLYDFGFVFYSFASCSSTSVESHRFFDVLLSCAWIYCVATLFCIEINYSSKRRHSVVNSHQHTTTLTSKGVVE